MASPATQGRRGGGRQAGSKGGGQRGTVEPKGMAAVRLGGSELNPGYREHW